ncbi:MAG: pilus assembly protein CpaD [Hyphomicrobiales bacterium]|nr:pilus assembly protein CpaD [Hyphomicrobiales bacterium]
MFRVSISETHSSKIPSRSMTIVSLLAAALVTGCASAGKDKMVVGTTPDDYRSRHPIVVSESETVEDIPISGNMRELSFRDRNVVSDFASRFRRTGGRSMQVMVPSQSANEAAARRISAQVVTALIDEGINRSQIAVVSYHAGDHSNSAPIRISFLALAANVGQCGVWNENIAGNSENRQYSNFGCATQNNLAKIIANPADLIGPRGESTIDATRRDTVITNWRENGSSSLPDQF